MILSQKKNATYKVQMSTTQNKNKSYVSCALREFSSRYSEQTSSWRWDLFETAKRYLGFTFIMALQPYKIQRVIIQKHINKSSYA